MSRHRLNLDLQGVNGNAFSLIGHFRKEARRAGWTTEEIEKVTEEAQSKNYDHLLQTLLNV